MEMEDQHTGEMLVCEDQKNELEIQLNTLQQQVSRMMQQRYAKCFQDNI